MNSSVLWILASCTNPSPVRPTAVELTDTTVVESAPEIVASLEAPAAIVPEPFESEVVALPSVAIEVRSGESLVLLADLAHVRAEDVADLNSVDVKAALVPGQSLQVPVPEAEQTDFLARRDAWFAGKVERYVARRGGVVGLQDRRVGTGDTAWSIARDEGRIPMWIVSFYNPDANLDRLGIGDHLTVPMFRDTVADASPPDGPVE